MKADVFSQPSRCSAAAYPNPNIISQRFYKQQGSRSFSGHLPRTCSPKLLPVAAAANHVIAPGATACALRRAPLPPSRVSLRPSAATAPGRSHHSLSPRAPQPLCASRPGSSPSPSSKAAADWAPNPVELVRREVGLQSNRLDAGLRDRVEAAVERLGCRVTVGDVAAKAGVKLSEADEALKALAYDTQASLKVSSEGDIVYGFSPDFRSRLRNRSLVLRLLPLARRAARVAAYLTRIAFGTALIASVAVVWLAVLALLSSRGGDRDDRRGGGGGYVSFHSNSFMNFSDLWFYWDPSYSRASAERAASGTELNFVEAIFSFVFGDGDPNLHFEEERWKELAAMIRAKGGVVTAEEMAPFLDPPAPAPRPRRGSATAYVPYPDESFVLPALIKFGGEPVVDEQGRILYAFPALQRTGVKQQRSGFFRQRRSEFVVPQERQWDFTAASPGQVAGIIGLGLLNLVGVVLLSGLMADPRSVYLLAAQGLGWVGALLGPLQLYAGAFFAIPCFRWLLGNRRNEEIEERVERREAAVDLLNDGSDPGLEDKLAAARAMAASGSSGRLLGDGGPRLVADDDIVFDSGREASPQLEAVEADDWEQRLAGRTGGGAWEAGREGRRGDGVGGGGGGGGGGGRVGGWRRR